ncbi:MAG: hypothetical protein GFH27_549281n450 [Chloroflexi bacterium AL-W]|nr:hypothetical protein [Chloroflexi bacterium AL-N1]NOK70943.1 hypothetical protein [Chloroflexi bacterium AL-N10]NOK73216.1 hypothetical protein [Chloroflexi bacterium AL-N5]NOK80113.1 hypothetical protein [Chloroflexi bacterium AL-W]NOK88032.1 hypothetical protein [Chloroflexi bacterium AL-N15]
MIDPYATIGLRGNPFVVEATPGVPGALWIDRGFSVAPESGKKQFIQVIGPKGAGKTSLLLHWREQVAGPYLHFPLGWGRWRLPPIAAMAYWDEADRIPSPFLWYALYQAARQNATIIAGTHVDLTCAAQRHGFAVQTIERPPLDVATLRAWVTRRIAAVRLSSAPDYVAPDDELLTRIAQEAGESWRVAADHLHIWVAETAVQAARQVSENDSG